MLSVMRGLVRLTPAPTQGAYGANVAILQSKNRESKNRVSRTSECGLARASEDPGPRDRSRMLPLGPGSRAFGPNGPHALGRDTRT